LIKQESLPAKQAFGNTRKIKSKNNCFCLFLAYFAYFAGKFLVSKQLLKEIERKTGEEIYAEFIRQEDYQLGPSFISDECVTLVK